MATPVPMSAALPARRDRSTIVALVLALHGVPFAWLHWQARAALPAAPPTSLEVRVLTESPPPAPAVAPTIQPPSPRLPARPEMAIPEVSITAAPATRPMTPIVPVAATTTGLTSATASPSPSGPVEPTRAAARPVNALPITPPSAESSALNNRPPGYPAMSRRLGEQGQVLLAVWVERDGRVGQIRLHRSSGYPLLDQAALDAVRHWRYQPATRGEETLATWFVQQVDFVLDR